VDVPKVRRRRMPVTKSVETKILNNLDKTEEIVTDEVEETLSESIVNPAHITVGGKLTRNLGDYNSAQVTVAITRPCRDTDEDVERVYAESSDWVEDKIRIEMDRVG